MKYLQAAGTVLILAAVHRLYMYELRDVPDRDSSPPVLHPPGDP